jgi:hypothetical protein
MNVRCGNDFNRPRPGAKVLAFGDKTPLSWFAACLRQVREAAGRPVRAYVVSDGTRRQLRELLAIDDVVFLRPGNAITDLLTLSRARVLLASGSSSFSAWGAFLGQMPAISHPGQPLSVWRFRPAAGQSVLEYDPAAPSTTFLAEARERLRSP